MGRTAQTIRKHDWNTDMAVLVWHPHRDRCSASLFPTMKEPPLPSMHFISEAISVCLGTCIKRKKFRKEILNRPLFLKGWRLLLSRDQTFKAAQLFHKTIVAMPERSHCGHSFYPVSSCLMSVLWVHNWEAI